MCLRQERLGFAPQKLKSTTLIGHGPVCPSGIIRKLNVYGTVYGSLSIGRDSIEGGSLPGRQPYYQAEYDAHRVGGRGTNPKTAGDCGKFA